MPERKYIATIKHILEGKGSISCEDFETIEQALQWCLTWPDIVEAHVKQMKAKEDV